MKRMNKLIGTALLSRQALPGSVRWQDMYRSTWQLLPLKPIPAWLMNRAQGIALTQVTALPLA